MAARLVERQHGDYFVTTDRGRVDVEAVHRYLCDESYWAAGRTLTVQRRAIEHSHLVVGAYDGAGRQCGFARMVTDLATFAWLADVYVVESARGVGLGRTIVQTAVEHPDVVDVGRQLLATADAHGLYSTYGYAPLTEPDKWMFRVAT